MSRQRLRRIASVTGVIATCFAVTATTANAATSYPTYVGLGDSYAAGAGVPNTIDVSCDRSDHNYPHLTSQSLGSTLTDMSCSGAKTGDMTQPQSGTTNPPQFNGLQANTSLVTVTIGGNDIGFAGILVNCGSMGAVNPNGTPCTDYYTAGGKDQISDAINATAPKVASVIQGIHQRSPQAKVVVANYLDILPLQGSCWGPNNTIAPGDYPYLNAKEQQLNQMLSDQAAANNATLADAYTDSIGHDLCKASGTAWVEGVITTNSAPVHPNALGEQGYSQAVLKNL